MKCFYEGESLIKCGDIVRTTLHDTRGCVDVCDEHAMWRMTTSMAGGHGAACAVNSPGVDLRKLLKECADKHLKLGSIYERKGNVLGATQARAVGNMLYGILQDGTFTTVVPDEKG